MTLLHRSLSRHAPPGPAAWLVVLALLALSNVVGARSAEEDRLNAQVLRLARDSVAPARQGLRIEVEVGVLDPRLKLAPCARVTPYLPPHTRLWGVTRIGVRCDEGARWNVYLPVKVKVFARAPAATQALPVGTVLEAAHLDEIEVDLAGDTSAVIQRPGDAVGRALNRPLRQGQPVRQADLRPRQWFAVGDTVRIVAAGAGYAITSEGQALVAGFEGQLAKVRTESGRVVIGRPSGQRQIEVSL